MEPMTTVQIWMTGIMLAVLCGFACWLVVLGMLELKLKQALMRNILSVYEQKLIAEPAKASNWAAKGDALFYLDKLDEAKEAYDKALEIDPANREALVGRIAVVWRNKNWNGAGVVSAAERAMTKNPLVILDIQDWRIAPVNVLKLYEMYKQAEGK